MLLLRLKKEEYDKLSDVLKSEYIADGDGYKLDVSGVEDTGALKRAKDRESQLRREAESHAKELETRLEELSGDDARKKGDIATLEKAWQKKLDDTKSELETSLKSREMFIQNQLVEGTADKLARELSKAPKIMLPHIRARLTADLTGDIPSVKVLGKDGKLSDLTVDQLADEFRKDDTFSEIILATKASGGGAASKTKNGSAGNGGLSEDKSQNLAAMNPKDLASVISSRKEG